MEKVKDHIVRATELTALSVYRLIKEKSFSPQDLLTEEESKAREKLIDQAGVDAMYAALTDIPFVLEVVGSEGRKHIHQYGEALPTLEGTFGSGSLKVDMVNDVVEGSKAAKLNSPGAVSVIAVGSNKGLMPTPTDIDYMDKLFGPSELVGKISIDKPVEENLAEVVSMFGVKPSEINIVAMDRDRNAHLIKTCQKFGVNLILIQAGDFLPSVLSCMHPKDHKKGIHLVMGIGGFEEGVMAAVAAKALGGVAEGRGWSPDQEIAGQYKRVWKIDDLVAGKREDCLVSISSITGDHKWFNLPEVREKVGGHEVTTLTVGTNGVNINTKIHH
ncbi:MAG: fructose-bisphosphatase class II family protein [Candidatus Daviesbacteria bacterium]|nr:fructose-bisphosphatase class II family protein [Candidatus Daviesbacteria bacterium]